MPSYCAHPQTSSPTRAAIALKIGHPVYDCLYLACAEVEDSPLVTADIRLRDAARAYPGVDVWHIAASDVVERIVTAATALVIQETTLLKLIAAYTTFSDTADFVIETVPPLRPGGPRILTPEQQDRYFNTPAYLHLVKLISDLSYEERIDLMALAWFGREATKTSTWSFFLNHAYRIGAKDPPLRSDIGTPLAGGAQPPPGRTAKHYLNERRPTRHRLRVLLLILLLICNITSFMKHQNRRTLPSHVPRPRPSRRPRAPSPARAPRGDADALLALGARGAALLGVLHRPHPEPNTRIAYLAAVRRFAGWCEHRGLALDELEPMLVAAYIEELTRERSSATVKQHLAALRMLFDWLVVGQVLPFNPASSVRGPKHVVKSGKTPVLSAKETRVRPRRHRRHDPGGPS